MSGPDYLGALDATWPAAEVVRAGPWAVRRGEGGGQRVACATAEAAWVPGDIALAEAAQAALRQRSLFMLRAGDEALDIALAALGYEVVDPVALWSAEAGALAGGLPPLAAFAIWPPLAVMRDIWAEGGIGPERVAVMERAAGVGLLGRAGDRPVGAAFVARAGEVAMLHALEVRPEARRQGVGRHLVRAAAGWAEAQGARHLALAVTKANAPANALYASLGMAVVGEYHYRRKPAP